MHKIFTKLFLICTCLVCALHAANAQDSTTVKQKKDGGKNLLKINLTAIPLNNYSFMYERKIGRKTSLAVGYRFMKEGGLPLKSNFKTLIDDEELFDRLDQFQTGNSAVTPEIRFYMGKGVFRGFYLAPFAPLSFTSDFTSTKGRSSKSVSSSLSASCISSVKAIVPL